MNRPFHLRRAYQGLPCEDIPHRPDYTADQGVKWFPAKTDVIMNTGGAIGGGTQSDESTDLPCRPA